MDAFNIFGDENIDCDSNSSSSEPSVYVFGYGSLIWNPGFAFTECLTGCKFYKTFKLFSLLLKLKKKIITFAMSHIAAIPKM